jgi:RimJ/RimL family protein N-acetyltransferase
MVAIQDKRGGRLKLAQLEPSDREPLRRLFYRLSPETLYRRFTSPIARPDQVRPDRLLDVDHRDREAIVAVDDGEIVGVARYFRQPGSDAAELAIVVADAWQGQGLATRMLAALAGQASAAGIERFTLITQADNSPALRLLRRVDPSVRLALSYGVYETTVPVAALRTATEPSASAAADREEALTLGHREPKNDLSVVDH